MSNLAFSEIVLSHFRSHKVARLSLDGGPVAIFGPNGAGKTNVLEAISLFSPGRGMRRASAEEIGRKPESLGWKVSGVLQSLHQVHEVETWAEPDSNRQVKIDGKAAAQTALGRVARVLWLVPSMDRLWIDGAEGRRRFLDRMTLSFEPLHADAVLTYEKAMRERNRLLKDQVSDSSWYIALEAQMAKSGAEISKYRTHALERVKAAQANAQTSFPAANLDLIGPDEDPFPVTEQALADAFLQGRRRDMMAGRTLTGPHRADLVAKYAAKDVDAKQCSTGEQKALLISLILSNARAIAEDFGAPPLLLLDEISAHLDSERRAALYDEICALGAQAWMTGTGAELFSDLEGRAQFIEVRDENGVSKTIQK